MAITKVRLPERATAELTPAVIDDIRRNLFAIDCQICGTPLGARTPALTVVEMNFGSLLHAILHHETCAEPRWGADAITLPAEPVLSYRTMDVLMSMAFTGGHVDGAAVNLPLVVVNPSLEAVFLSRDEGGDWRVETVDRYVRRGLHAGSREIQLTTVPGGAVHLEELGVGSSPALMVRLGDSDRWVLRTNSVIAADIRRQRGIGLVVTTVADPTSFDTSRMTEELFALLDPGDCAVGWIPLAGALQTSDGGPMTPGPPSRA